MTIATLQDLLPDYAKDLRLNLTSLPTTPNVTPQQLYGLMLVSALASRSAVVIQHIAAEAALHMKPEAIMAARLAHALMAMNNIYYRFAHLSSDTEFATMPAKLRMSSMANPGVDKVDFEMWALAVSVVNGCGMCIDSHVKQLLTHNLSRETVQNIARIAAIIHAIAATLEGEAVIQMQNKALAA